MWIFSANTSPSAPPKIVKSWREHEHLAAVDRAPTGDDAVGERPVLLDPEAVRPVAGEHVELDERARVEQQVDALAGGELAPLVLAPDRRLRAGVQRLFLELGELFEPLGDRVRRRDVGAQVVSSAMAGRLGQAGSGPTPGRAR